MTDASFIVDPFGRGLHSGDVSRHGPPHPVLVLLSCLAMCACSEDAYPDRSGGDGDSSLNGGDGSGGAGGGTGTGNGTGNGNGVIDDCGGDTFTAFERDYVEIFVVFDKSSSMIGEAWEAAVAEMKDFVNDPASGGLHVALRYFSADEECDPADYAVPDVPSAILPDNAQPIGDSLDRTEPDGETGTRPALEGAILYANQRYAEPDYTGRVVVVVITDGAPDVGDCPDNTTQSTAAVAKDGYAGWPSVTSYVIGTLEEDDDEFAELDPIAEAGGTERALRIDLAMPGKLSEEMARIRNLEIDRLPCTYALPPEYPDVNDPSLVDFQHNGQSLPKVDGEASCDASVGGWYLDDPDQPHHIETCPATCAELGKGGTVQTKLGCPPLVVL